MMKSDLFNPQHGNPRSWFDRLTTSRTTPSKVEGLDRGMNGDAPIGGREPRALARGGSTNNKRGLTLVETVIAMFIAAITLVGFLQVCNTSSLMLRNIKYRMRAINIAQAELENVKALGYEGIDNTAFTPYRATYVIIDEGLSASSADDIIGEMRTRVREVVNPPYKGKIISAEVMWRLMGESKQEFMETLLYSYQ